MHYTAKIFLTMALVALVGFVSIKVTHKDSSDENTSSYASNHDGSCQYDHYSRKDNTDVLVCYGNEKDQDNLIVRYSPDRIVRFYYNASKSQQLAGIKDHCSNGVKRIDYAEKKRSLERYHPEEVTIDVYCNVPAPAPAPDKLTAEDIN